MESFNIGPIRGPNSQNKSIIIFMYVNSFANYFASIIDAKNIYRTIVRKISGIRNEETPKKFGKIREETL